MRHAQYACLKALWHGVAWVLAACLLGGCAPDDTSDLQRYINEIKARPGGAIPPLPEIRVVEPFLFRPDGLRDPFTPVEQPEKETTAASAGSGIKPDFARVREELESFPLDSLRMVGTLRNKQGLWALVRTNDGTVHRVRTGNYLGKNHGRILQITEDKIELMEIVPDQQPGTWREQPASLTLVE